MANNVTFSVNYTAFDRQIKELILATERNSADVVKQQTRLFLRDAVKFTPPTGNAPVSESLNAQRKFGMGAVAGDIRHGFLEAADINLKNGKLNERIKLYAKRQEFDKLTTIFKRLKFRGKVIAFPNEQSHNKLRGSGGRVKKSPNNRNFVMRSGSVADFIKKKQGLVGMAKSGWAKACAVLGVALPGWITRHTTPGFYRGDLHGPRPFCTVGNEVDYIQSAGARLRVVQRALDRRAESMKHQLEKIMGQTFSGYKGNRPAQPVSAE